MINHDMSLDEIIELKKKYLSEGRESDVQQLISEILHLRATLDMTRDMLDRGLVSQDATMLRFAARLILSTVKEYMNDA